MPPALRIAILVNPLTLGRKWGAHAPELARELLGRGHTVRGFGASPESIPRSGDSPEDAAGAAAGAPGVAGFRPDAILAYDALSPAAWLGARVAKKLDVPLVLVEAGSQSASSDGMLRAIGRMLWGRAVRARASHVVALDAVARGEVLRAGFDVQRVVVLPSGVDCTRYRPGLASAVVGRHHLRGRVLLYHGAIRRERGLEVLLRAFAASIAQTPDWSLAISGEGPFDGELRSLAERLGVGARVHRLGRARDEELPGLFSASTLLAVPSLDDGVRGLSVPRALACGLPVIASDRAALRLLVQDGVQGLIVPAGDEAAWADALRRAAGAPGARRRWSTAARRTAEERHAWPRVAEAFERLILPESDEDLRAAPRSIRPTGT